MSFTNLTRCMACALFLAMATAFLIASCSSTFDLRLPNCPTEISGLWAARVTNYSDSGVTFDGGAFLDEKFYAGSSAGLLEVESTRLTRVFRCQSNIPDNFSNVTADRAHRQLWTRNLRAEKSLLRFDGAAWHDVGLPPKSEGYTRSDISALRMFSTESKFWLQDTSKVSRWNDSERSWINEPIPEVECLSSLSGMHLSPQHCFASIAPLGDEVAFILRGEFRGDVAERSITPNLSEMTPDRVLLRKGGEWVSLPAQPIPGLYTEEVVAGKENSFVRTYQDLLFRITSSSIKRIPSLGQIDAITTTSEGNLLVAFFGKGIFEYRGTSWVERVGYPFSSLEGHFVRIAEREGQIALMYNRPLVNGNLGYPSRLWISINQELRQIELRGPAR